MLCSPCGKKEEKPCCTNCNIVDVPLSKCSRCVLVVYCSKDCQSQDWKNNHKKKCISLEERRPDVQQKISEKSKDSEICCICLDPVTNIHKSRHLVCSHSFHSECIYKWLEEKQCCPLCNKIFSKDDNLAIEYIRALREGIPEKVDIIIKKLELCKISAITSNMLSELYISKRLYNKAENTLKQSNKYFPDNISTHFNLALLYTLINQRHLARKFHEKCLYLLSKTSTDFEGKYYILLNYAIFLVQTPKMPEISQDFGKLVEAKTLKKKFQMIEQHNDFSGATIEDKKYAQTLLEMILAENKDKNKLSKVYFLLAKIAQTIQEELHLYILAIENDDDNYPIANYRVAIILLKQENYKEATDYYEKALVLDKSLIDERISYFFGLSSIGNMEEGIQRLKEILTDYPNCIKVQNLLTLVDQCKNIL